MCIATAKLSITLQSRSQGLIKQYQDLSEQIEQTYVELKTFETLRQHEIGAIPKRKEVRPLNVLLPTRVLNNHCCILCYLAVFDRRCQQANGERERASETVCRAPESSGRIGSTVDSKRCDRSLGHCHSGHSLQSLEGLIALLKSIINSTYIIIIF